MYNTEYKVVYENNKPHGIRNQGGFILFFPDITKYDGQEKRYRNEVMEQYKLADFLKQQLEENYGKGNS